MPIYKPTVYPETIRRLVEKASSGELDIPEFQREFVWTKHLEFNDGKCTSKIFIFPSIFGMFIKPL